MNRNDPLARGPTVGIDAGASLVKLAIEHRSGELRLEKLPSHDVAGVADRVASCRPGDVCLTGGGAASIEPLLAAPTTLHNEFASWAAGARRILRGSGDESLESIGSLGRFILVSLGTGTSIQLIDGSSSRRVAGTALGGGTMLGLGRALTGARDFAEFCRLASRGSRKAVDLQLSDVYAGGDVPLADAMTASNFGKLSRGSAHLPEPADLAAGLVNLVAENVGLIVGHVAAASGSKRVFIGGSTLSDNSGLETALTRVLAAFGCQASVLADGEYTGALGAIELLHTQP